MAKGNKLDMELLEKIDKKDRADNMTKVQKNQQRELIKEYGITGITENKIPIELQSKKTIEELEEVLRNVKQYGNADIFQFVPVEFENKLKKYEPVINYLNGYTSGHMKELEYNAFPKEYVSCHKCGKYKHPEVFFVSYEKNESGKLHICSDCIEQMVENFYDKYDNEEYILLMMCLYTNCIFVQDVAKLAIKNLKNKDASRTRLYNYYRQELNQRKRFDKQSKDKMTFEYSNFKGNIFNFVDIPLNSNQVYFEEQNVTKKDEKDVSDIEKLKVTWGAGYQNEEYSMMDELFDELIKFQPQKTILHKNALREYIKMKVRLDKALSENADLKDIKLLREMTDKAAQNANIKLDQLTSDNLGDSVNSWSQMVSLAEEYNSLIPILPKVKKMPYDDIDFIIYICINYMRRLQELPEVVYEDIWRYVDEKYITEMKKRKYTDEQIEKERQERNAIFKELSDDYLEELWLNPNLIEGDEDED